jgi:2'-5' RNA ligase
MRAFIGIWLSVEMRREIETFVLGLRQNCSAYKWTQPDNLHITLKFLGDISSKEVDTLIPGLQTLASDTVPFQINLGPVGYFPNHGPTRVVWIGVAKGAAQLSSLAGKVEKVCTDNGLPPADKPFVSHLTIGRARQGSLVTSLPVNNASFKTGMTVTGFSLIESQLRPGGPIYSSRADIPLNAAGKAD